VLANTEHRENWLRRIALLGAGALLILILLVDLARKSIAPTLFGANIIADALSIGIAILLLPFIDELIYKRRETPLRLLLLLTVTLVAVVAMLIATLLFFPGEHFDIVNGWYVPRTYNEVFMAVAIGAAVTVASIVSLLCFRALLLIRASKSTKFMVTGLIVVLVVNSLSRIGSAPAHQSTIQVILEAIAIAVGTILSFRSPWIIELHRKQKLIALGSEFFLMLLFIGLRVPLSGDSFTARSVSYFSACISAFISPVAIVGIVYFFFAFASTLFHLPTSEIYERRVAQISSLRDFGHISTQIFDRDQLVQSVMKLAKEITDARGCWLELLPESEKMDGLEPSRKERLSEAANDTEINSAALPFDELRNEVLLNKSLALKGEKPEVLSKKWFRNYIDNVLKPRHSLLAVPLRVHDTVHGILYLAKTPGESFDREDIASVMTLADNAAMAFENSRLFEEALERRRLEDELAIAHSIQQQLLPAAFPQIPHIEIEARCFPSAQIGGDYFDVIRIDDQRLLVAIGDVSGKGIPAALLMANLQAAVHTIVDPSLDLVRATERLNSVIFSNTPVDRFITFFWGIVDSQHELFQYVNAGHNPPFLLRSSGAVERLSIGGPLLGVIGDNVCYELGQIPFGRDDVLLIFTDGVTEAVSMDHEEFGEARLLETIGKARNLSASEIVEEIRHRVVEFSSGVPQNDDATMVVLKAV